VWLEHGRIREIGSAKAVAEAYLSSQSMENSKRFVAVSGVEGDIEKIHEPQDDNGAPDAPLHTGEQGSAFYREVSQPELARRSDAHPSPPVRDMRQDILRNSDWRNDIELPAMPMDDGFGI